MPLNASEETTPVSMLLSVIPGSICTSGNSIVYVPLDGSDVITLSRDQVAVLTRLKPTPCIMEDHLAALSIEDASAMLRSSSLPRALRKIEKWAISYLQSQNVETRQHYLGRAGRAHRVALNRLAESGVLAPIYTALDKIKSGTDEHSDPDHSQLKHITKICIPTANRPKYLDKCISSFTHSLKRHSREDVSIIVIEDSYDRNQEYSTKNLVRLHQKAGGITVRCVGAHERELLINSLREETGISEETINFAILPPKVATTEGGARNTASLLAGATCFLQTDDDTQSAYASLSPPNATLSVAAVGDPYETYFFKNQEENEAAFALRYDLNPLALHEAVLGKRLAQLLNEFSQVNWMSVNPHVMAFLSSAEPYVGITTTGASGDPGMDSMWHFTAAASKGSVERLYSSLEMYETATTVRQVLRAVPNSCLNYGGVFQAMSFAMDNTYLQPPFFPIGRGLDDAFALVYFMLHRTAFIGHIPYAIKHESEGDRRYKALGQVQRDLHDCVISIPISRLLKLCVSGVDRCSHSAPAQRLRSLGEQLEGLGNMSKRAFWAFIREKYIVEATELLDEIQTKSCVELSRGDLWRKDLQKISDFYRASLHTRIIVVDDISSALSLEEKLQFTQLAITRYGRLLRNWQLLREAANYVNSNLALN